MSVGALYAPVSSVVSVRERPLCVSKTVTVAPDTTPPLWSVTFPRMRPKLPCEYAGKQSKSRAKTAPNNCIALRHRTPQVVFGMEVKPFILGPPSNIKDFDSESDATPQKPCSSFQFLAGKKATLKTRTFPVFPNCVIGNHFAPDI